MWGEERCHLLLYRILRRRRSEELPGDLVEVRSTGERKPLSPMSAFERKVVHDEVLAAGLVSESEGAEPRRFVVILPA